MTRQPHLALLQLTLLFGCSTATNGCIVLPTIPLNAPAYGHAYKIVDENNRPVKSGLLLLESVYEMAPPMFNVYEIKDGQVRVPPKVAVRYGQSLWGAAYFPLIPIAGYFGMFHNPNFTKMIPLADGLAPRDTDLSLFQKGLSPPPETIVLVRVIPEMETKNLRQVAQDLDCYNEGTAEDKAAQKKAIDSIHRRLDSMPALVPPTQPKRVNLPQSGGH